MTQSQSGANTIFSGKMGSAEPNLFAGQRGNPNRMRGLGRVQFTALPNGAISRGVSYVLVIAE